MSHIPSSAMPQAKPAEAEDQQESGGGSLKERAGKIADKARENPKTAAGVGAAVVAGVVAAAAIATRKKSSGGTGGKSSGTKTSKKKTD